MTTTLTAEAVAAQLEALRGELEEQRREVAQTKAELAVARADVQQISDSSNTYAQRSRFKKNKKLQKQQKTSKQTVGLFFLKLSLLF